MTCLTVTPASAAEAIREHAGLIVSHHPVLFREVKKIRADFPETGYLWNLARAGIAIASPHTAFDNTHGRYQRHPLPAAGPGRGRPATASDDDSQAVPPTLPGRSSSSCSRPRTNAKRFHPRRSRPARAASVRTRNARSPSRAKARFSGPTRPTRPWASAGGASRSASFASSLSARLQWLAQVLASVRAPSLVRRARDRRLSPACERSRQHAACRGRTNWKPRRRPQPRAVRPARQPAARVCSRGIDG